MIYDPDYKMHYYVLCELSEHDIVYSPPETQVTERLARGFEIYEALRNDELTFNNFNLFMKTYDANLYYRETSFPILHSVKMKIQELGLSSIVYTWPISEEGQEAIAKGKTLYHVSLKSFQCYVNQCRSCHGRCRKFHSALKNIMDKRKPGLYKSTSNYSNINFSVIVDTIVTKKDVTIVYLDQGVNKINATPREHIEMWCNHSQSYRASHKMVIGQYNHKKRKPLFFDVPRTYDGKNNPFYIGIELECVVKGDTHQEYSKNLSEIFKLCKSLKSIQLIKYDGSISSSHGIEIVTEPMTLEYFKDNYFKIIDTISKYAMVNESCGTHIHFNKNFFSDYRPYAVVDMISRLFINELQIECGRQCSRYCEFVHKSSYRYGTSSSRYEYINFQPRNTIEFRLLAGTLDPKKIYRIAKILKIIAIKAKELSNTNPHIIETTLAMSWEHDIISNIKDRPVAFELELVPRR